MGSKKYQHIADNVITSHHTVEERVLLRYHIPQMPKCITR